LTTLSYDMMCHLLNSFEILKMKKLKNKKSLKR